MTTVQDDKLDRKEAARFLGISEAFLAADVITRRHQVPFYKIGRRCVYVKSQLDTWMAARMVNAPAVETRSDTPSTIPGGE